MKNGTVNAVPSAAAWSMGIDAPIADAATTPATAPHTPVTWEVELAVDMVEGRWWGEWV
jgi:hypothetical protein